MSSVMTETNDKAIQGWGQGDFVSEGGVRDRESLGSSEARHREETETNRPEETKDKNSNG